MRYSTLLLLALLAATPRLTAQNLPEQMHFSADGHQLLIGGLAPDGLYDDTLIRSIYLDFPQTNYWQLMQQNYNDHEDIPATLTIDGEVYDSVGVRFKGMTSYSQIPNSQKKSFNITLDYVHDGQDLMGYETLNLNNSYEDQSFMREPLYLHLIRKYIPAAKGNYVHLFINNQDWGLYINVQQLNKDYLKEWFMSNDGTNWRADRPAGATGGGGPGGPGWGDGTAALNNLGADTASYKSYYTLKSTDKAQPWDDLVRGCVALDTTDLDNIETVLPNYFDLDRTLWFLACEIAFADDDSYIFKGKMDYYVYYEAETGRLTPLEYDGNSAFYTQGVNWGAFYNADKVNYPLLNRLLAVPALRQRYLAHLRTIISTDLNANTTALVDAYKAFIDAQVQSDPKKLYTYAQFQSATNSLKNFVNNRRNNLLGNAEVAQVAPSINSVSWWVDGVEWAQPSADQQVTVQATIAAPASGSVDHATLYYATGWVGNFSKTALYDDGQHNDGAAADGVFGGSLPQEAAGTWVRFYVEATAGNAAKSVSYAPVGAEHDVFIYNVLPVASASQSVAINEVMASNQEGATDEQGQHEDWVELYNKSAQTVDLSGYALTDNLGNLAKWRIPAGTSLAPDDYLILWADEDSSQGPLHMNFKLSANGERLLLLDPSLALVDSVSFGAQQTDRGLARVPNGTGPFVIQEATFGANNTTVGTHEASPLANTLRVYPNPSRDWLQLVNSSPDAAQVQVVNLLGQVVYQGAVNQSVVLTVSDWPGGFYVVKTAQSSQKVLVQH